MSIEKMEDSLEIIRALGDYPNTENDLSAEELKELFDKGPELIKSFINNIIVPAINNLETNGVTSSPDTTLSASGVAADAAAVGKALAQKADSGIVSGTEIVDSLDALTELVKSSVLSMGEHSVKFVSVQLDTAEFCGGGELRIFKGVDGNAMQRGSAMLATTDGPVLLLTGFNEGGSDNPVWSWDTEWKYVYRDTGWISLELSDSFALYNGQAYNQPRYRVSGNTVTIRGSVTPAEDLTSSSSDIVIATGIPAEYCPKVSEYFVCQGSVMNRWLCTVKSTGEITISKYGTTEYAEIPTGAWLAFCVTYQLGGF